MRQTKEQIQAELARYVAEVDAKQAQLNQMTLERNKAQGDAHSWEMGYRRLTEELKGLRLSLDEQAKKHQEDKRHWLERKQQPYKPHDFDEMEPKQLVSAAEEAIAAVRRKGMVEAEGLASKHRGLLRETDIELLEGTAKNYLDRAKALKDEKAREAAREKFDTRPLSEKLAATTKADLNKVRTPGWWQIPVKEMDHRCICGRDFKFCVSDDRMNRRIGHVPEQAPKEYFSRLDGRRADGPIVSNK